jgi:hypothetical protein
MISSIAIQADMLALLLSEARLNGVNIVSERKEQLAGELNLETVYTTVRNGKGGAGILIEHPYANCNQPNVPGPVLDWVFPIVTVDNETINMAATTGTGLTSEDIAQIVLDVVHMYADTQYGTTFQCDSAGSIKFAGRFPGCIDHRILFKAKMSPNGNPNQTPRAAAVSYSNSAAQGSAGIMTLSTTEPDTTPTSLQIFYTLGSSITIPVTPAPFPGNSGAGAIAGTLYTAPFAVQPGDRVRAVTYVAGKVNSSSTFYQN